MRTRSLAFLPLAFPDKRVLAVDVAFGIVFTMNLLAAAPPTTELGAVFPVGGAAGVAGSVLMLGILGAIFVFLARRRRAAWTLKRTLPMPPLGRGDGRVTAVTSSDQAGAAGLAGNRGSGGSPGSSSPRSSGSRCSGSSSSSSSNG
jgi:hypothetical protein